MGAEWSMLRIPYRVTMGKTRLMTGVFYPLFPRTGSRMDTVVPFSFCESI